MTIKPPHAAQIPQLRQLWQEAFGDTDAFLDSFFTTAFSEDRCLCLWQGESLGAAAYWFGCTCRGEKCAYIYAVATAKAHRGKGLCHALMAAVHDCLRSRGYALAVLVPGSPSLFRLYGGMGYESFGPLREFSCAPGEEPVALRAVEPAEYAVLRRQLLPPGGVVQEGENLEFLNTQARLYAGEDFLLAAVTGNGDLFAPELLGNTAAAPGILNTLGCRTGIFRTPGGGTPFAMYYTLTPAPAPAYFALAFD